jgi:phosphatidylinositol alpha-1,6-mannosyltransferase
MSALARPLRVFLVGSEFFRTPGGIQQVNCLLLETLLDFCALTLLEVEVFSFGDVPGLQPEFLSDHRSFQWHAFNHSPSAMAMFLARRLRAARPHVVLFTHAHLAQLAQVVRVLAPGARLAVLGHGVEVWKPLPPSIRRWLAQADAVVAPSRFTRDKLVEVNQVSESRVEILPHGLPPDWPQAALDTSATPRTGKTLLSVTRIGLADAYKGLDVVLDALPAVLARHPGARYVIAGDGNDRPRLERLAQRLGVAAQVEFRGEVSGDELHRLYAEADIFVLPSQKEGFGIVFLEAMYSRLPVVAARAAGTLDVVVDGVTGALATPNQPGELAGILCGLLENAPRRLAWGEAGRQRVQANFLFAHFAGRWQRWLTRLTPEPVYAARQAAAFASYRALEESPA